MLLVTMPSAAHCVILRQLDRERQRTERARKSLEDVLHARDRMNDEMLKEKTAAKEALFELDRVREALEREKQASQEMSRVREQMRDEFEPSNTNSLARRCTPPIWPENCIHTHLHSFFLPVPWPCLHYSRA
jgi:hypothetical protein